MARPLPSILPLTPQEVAAYAAAIADAAVAPSAQNLLRSWRDADRVGTLMQASHHTYYRWQDCLWSYAPATGTTDDALPALRWLGDLRAVPPSLLGPRPLRIIAAADRLPEFVHLEPTVILHQLQHPVDSTATPESVVTHETFPTFARAMWVEFLQWHYREMCRCQPDTLPFDPIAEAKAQMERTGYVWFTVGDYAIARAALRPEFVSLDGVWVQSDRRREHIGSVLTAARMAYGAQQGKSLALACVRPWNRASLENLRTAGFSQHSIQYLIK